MDKTLKSGWNHWDQAFTLCPSDETRFNQYWLIRGCHTPGESTESICINVMLATMIGDGKIVIG